MLGCAKRCGRSDFMRRDIDADLFDVALLADPAERLVASRPPGCAVLPMLSQTWSFLRASGMKLSPLLVEARARPTSRSLDDLRPFHGQDPDDCDEGEGTCDDATDTRFSCMAERSRDATRRS